MELKELMTLKYFLNKVSISRTSAYREVIAGRLRFTKVGRRSYVSREDANAWLSTLKKFPESITGEA